MITCKQCGVSKSEDEYFNNAIKLNGKDSKCKSCRKAHNYEYAEKNRDSLSVKRKEYYELHKEEILANKHDYYKQNRDEILFQKRQYIAVHSDVLRKQQKEWRGKNLEYVKKKSKENRDFIVRSALDLLGAVCKNCNLVEPEFLTIDHINVDGNLERKTRPALGWKRDLISGKSDPLNYQVLCHNCNQSRYIQDPVNHLKDAELTGIIKYCKSCGLNKDVSEFCSPRSHDKNKCLSCKRTYNADRRKNFLNMMGGKCACCGIGNPECLVVDHVKSDGSQKRRSGQRSGLATLIEATSGGIRNSDYQLLCWNCNYSKHLGGGLCIHQREGKSLLNAPTGSDRNPFTGNQEYEDFELDAIEIKNGINLETAKTFLDKFHYAGFGRGSVAMYGVHLGDELIGVVKFAHAIRQNVAATLRVADSELLELDRFCIHPARHKKNFASFIMSRVVKFIRTEFPSIKKLVSFADPRAGHSGSIYKASNWTYIGETSPSYYYEDRNGKEVNKKTLYQWAKRRGMKERECYEALGYKKIMTPSKHKFCYELK